ncbi:GAF domain-containing sensor histidine kinase [Clostridium sp. WILCCON 0269]|uniref:histidine kinase n=1 Tax=Candidatus Clostridium eludens TaxID=3381663 RepID=A0ABW8SPC1_9CLOT
MGKFEKTKEKVPNMNFNYTAEYNSTDEEIQFHRSVLKGINRIFCEALYYNTEEELGRLCLSILEELTQSKFSFIGELTPEGKFYTIAISNSNCNILKIPNETVHKKVSMEFTINDIYGQVLLNGEPVITNDPASHLDSQELMKDHPSLKSFLGIPLKDCTRTIGMIGLGNRKDGYTIRELKIIEAISPAIVQSLKYKKSQEALKQNEQSYRKLFNSTSEGIFLLAVNKGSCFKFIEINEVEKKFTELSNHQLELEDIYGVYSKEYTKLLINNLKMCIKTKNPIEFQVCQKFKSKLNYFSIKLIPMEDTTGQIYRIWGIRKENIVASHIKKFKNTRNAIKQFNSECNEYVPLSILIKNQKEIKTHLEKLLDTEKDKNKVLEKALKSKDEFFYLMIHEFKTPISVINLALQAIDLMYKEELTEKVRKYLTTIKQNINRQLRLVNNLLDIARINSGHLKMNKSYFSIVHVIEAIVNSVELYAKQKNVILKFNTNLPQKNIYSDEEKLERILLNLLSNALKFTPSGKSITVTLSIKKYENKNMISITVQDEGLGIPEDKQKTIFERFGQVDSSLSRQAEGTGLGLHLVKLLVNFLGGEILLNSITGKGSTFTVLLPSDKYETYYEKTVFKEISNPFFSGDNRIIQSTAIEFSDIYF